MNALPDLFAAVGPRTMSLLRQGGRIVALLAPLLVVACSGGSNQPSTTPIPDPPKTEAQLLQARFGPGEDLFSEASMQAILDWTDIQSPLLLAQVMEITDTGQFAEYESRMADFLAKRSAAVVFGSDIVTPMVAHRPQFTTVRVLQFPSILELRDSLNDETFTELMAHLFGASGDHIWLLGVEVELPFEPEGGYVNPELANLDREAATELLQMTGAVGDSGFDTNFEVIIDMLVSDSPDPFWMVNLIDFYEQANYRDGRDTDLTGVEANQIYSNQIFPQLLQVNTFPDLVMPVSLVLTVDDIGWEQFALVRYASRDAFLTAFPLSPTSSAALEHKEAGVENTLVYVSEVPGATNPPPEPPQEPERIGFEILQVVSPTEIRALVTPQITLAEFEALELPAGWIKNQPREGDIDGGTFFQSPGGTGPGDFTQEEHFGFNWLHVATVQESNIPLDNDGLLIGSRVLKFHQVIYNAGTIVYVLVSPEGDPYVRIGRDFRRTTDEFDMPDGWSLQELQSEEDLVIPLPTPTLVIRANNQDSFQGPVDELRELL